MELKYLPDEILSLVSEIFFFQEEAIKSKGGLIGGEVPSHEFRVFIRLRSDNNKCYQISAIENGPAVLSLGICTGTIWRVQQHRNELEENRDDLGKVIVQRNGATIREYPDFDSFWNEIN